MNATYIFVQNILKPYIIKAILTQFSFCSSREQVFICGIEIFGSEKLSRQVAAKEP